MNNKLPLISVVIPTHQEEAYIASCLDSIFRQEYPKERLQVIVVDNYSTDKTVSIAKKYNTEIVKSRILNAENSKMIGLKRSKGDYFIFLDADNRLIGKRWFSIMLKPHLKDPLMVGSFTDIVPDKNDSLLSQYLASFSFYSSPLFSYLSTKVKETIIEKKHNYYICKYMPGKIPPTGSCLYKTSYLKRANVLKRKKFMELDILVILSEKGYKRFAYIPSLGMYHSHVNHLKEVFTKRIRNINTMYLSDIDQRSFLWIDFSSLKDKVKILLWIVYAYSFILPIVTGILRAIKTQKLFFLYYEPVVTILETTGVIYAILMHPKKFSFLGRVFNN